MSKKKDKEEHDRSARVDKLAAERAAERERVRAEREARAKVDPPPGSHVPVYRERAQHEQALQVDHPALLIGCMCGWPMDKDAGDAQARAFLYGQHLDGTRPSEVDIIAASAPLNIDDVVLDEVLGETED